jgi:hypothetical protein
MRLRKKRNPQRENIIPIENSMGTHYAITKHKTAFNLNFRIADKMPDWREAARVSLPPGSLFQSSNKFIYGAPASLINVNAGGPYGIWGHCFEVLSLWAVEQLTQTIFEVSIGD